MADKSNSAPISPLKGAGGANIVVLRSPSWEPRICKYCKVNFQVRTCAILRTNASGNFCSRPCYNSYLRTIRGTAHKDYKPRVQLACGTCAKPIARSPSRAALFKDHFCSMRCRSDHHSINQSGPRNWNWRGGYHPGRGDDWNIVRKRALKRQPFCAMCGRLRGLQVHHIIPYRLTQDNRGINLVVLCCSHHMMVERATTKIEATEPDYETMHFIINNMLRSHELTMRAALLQRQRELRGIAA